MTDHSSRIVSVEIHGQRYPIRSALESGYVVELATYVHEKMQAAADESATGDSLKAAVLAALNIADEFFRCRQAQESRSGRLAARTEELERLVDGVIERLCAPEPSSGGWDPPGGDDFRIPPP